MNGPLDWEDELPDDDCDLSHAHSMFSELRLLSFLTTEPNRLIKGGLISEIFSLWLTYPKMNVKSLP